MKATPRHKLVGKTVSLPGGYVGKVVERQEHGATILVEAEQVDGATQRVWFAEADAKPLTAAELKALKAAAAASGLEAADPAG